MSGWTEADLADLAAIERARRRADERLAAQVSFLRERDTPWSVIGEVLGTSRQNAHKRFSHRLDQGDDAGPQEQRKSPRVRLPGSRGPSQDPRPRG